MITKKYLNYGVMLLILIGTFSCSQDDTAYAVGESWLESNTKVYYIDTMSIESSTFKYDSIIAESSARLILGAYTDDVFGYTESQIYTQFYSTDYTLDTEAVYDSIEIILKYDNYYYNDTLSPQKFSVYTVEEDITPDEDYYYNVTDFDISTTSIADVTIYAKPQSHDSLTIPLSDVYGEEMFNKILDNDINNSDEFLQEYQGISIVPDPTNTAILGFSKDSFVRIYYTIPDETADQELTYDIPFNSLNTFHHVNNDITGTIFSNLDDQETYLPSSDPQSNGYSYIQSGTGIMTRIAFPYLERIYDIEGEGSFIDANVEITLKKNSHTDNLSTRDSLNIYIIDQDSKVLSELTDYTQSTSLGLIDDDDTEFNTTTYTIPVKYFIEQKLSEVNGENWYLAIYSQEYNASADRYIFYGEDEEDDELKLKLELTYAIYDE